jgi:hypothetical protein
VVSREKVDLKEPRGAISPPWIEQPIYQCSKLVVVRGFISHAEIEVFVNGSSAGGLSDAGLDAPSGATVELSAELRAGDTVTAVQGFQGAQSVDSPAVVARDHRQDYPAGMPPPFIDPQPLFECGRATAVNGLVPGSTVTLTADGNQVAGFGAPGPWVLTGVAPPFELGQEVVAVGSLCGEETPPSAPVTVQARPASLPAPTIDPPIAGAELVVVRNLVHGATFELSRNGVVAGTWGSPGDACQVVISPLDEGDVLTVWQQLCPGDPTSPEGSTTVQPCSALGAPDVAPVEAGDEMVRLLDFVPGGRVKVFLSGVKVGDGTGPVVRLVRKVRLGETIHVLQEMGSCVSRWVRRLEVRCVAPALGEDPTGPRLTAVGRGNYDGGTFNVDGTTYPIRGTVYYPAERDGDDQPFNAALLAAEGPVPIVFMAHGNHARYRSASDPLVEECDPVNGFVEIPNHEGYDYFQRQLAGLGIIAVSVYSNPTNCWGGSMNIPHRAALIQASIRHFAGVAGQSGTFAGAIDLSRIGLMGHSRGGDAVVLLPEVLDVPGTQIRAVVSLAPTDSGASSGAPRGYALLAILPAADGDVRTNEGAHFYDRAEPAPFKCQLYIDGANHNFFNRQWPKDDGIGAGRLSRGQQERILSAYGCALFRTTLLGHDTAGYLTGRLTPAGVPAEQIHLSAVVGDQETVDDHEQGNGIEFNSLGEPTHQTSLRADEFEFRQSGAAFNGTFFGHTIGMVAEAAEPDGEFRTQLIGTNDLSRREVWIRVAEVLTGLPTTEPTGFELGLEDAGGLVAWVDSDAVGGIPRPYRRSDSFEKTMPSTLRFRTQCFRADSDLSLGEIVAIRLRLNRPVPRPLAFDDLQLVNPA